jgi:hypothetical protein
MQVVAIGAEGGFPQPDAAQHDAHRIHERQGEEPQGGDGGHGPPFSLDRSMNIQANRKPSSMLPLSPRNTRAR